MALSTSGGTTNKVSFGTGSTLNNLSTGTVLGWFYLDSVGANLRMFASKADGNNPNYVGWTFYRPGADGSSLRFEANRATSDLQVYSATSLLTATAWQFLAATWDTGGANGDQHLYRGTLTSLATEPSYGTQLVGSGALSNDAAEPLYALNSDIEGGNFSLDGDCALLAVWNAQLSLRQIKAQQFSLDKIIDPANCVLFCNLGFNGTGTQPDWSGNGNNGTVTGATLSAHVPIYGPSMIPSRGDLYIPVSALDIQGNEGRMVFGDA